MPQAIERGSLAGIFQTRILQGVPRFGETLRLAREGRGLTQIELRDASGVSQGQISKYERDQASPDVSDLLALARALGFSAEKLVAGHDPRYDLLCHQGGVELPAYLTGGVDAPATADLQQQLREAKSRIEHVREAASQLLKLAIGEEVRKESRPARRATPSSSQRPRAARR